MRNNKYMKVLQLGMQNEMEYRANYWLQMAGFMLPIMTQIFLWLAVFGSSGQARVLGYSLPEMLVYVVMAGVTGKLIATGFEYEIATDIKEGGLAQIHGAACTLFCLPFLSVYWRQGGTVRSSAAGGCDFAAVS
ncbi:hypothetical protein [Paenibacillus sp. RC334]|uniref:hypothetical protein n=1 Tax=Paenibacillus sp. RC334 TaxID=3045840 RepID=UPI0024BAFC00|nr:hypothetical protein [Paenibacillus sp. RC334]